MSDRPAWHEDDAFWEAFAGCLFPPETYEEAAEQVDRVIDLLDPDPGAVVLDVPCGVGRHAVEFASRGFRVTGVDATEPYLETARERARAVDVDVELAQGDMREFRRESPSTWC